MAGGEDQQRARARGPRGRRAWHFVAWLSVALTCLLVAVTLTGYTAFRDLFDKIHKLPVTGLGHRPPKYNNSLNILVIGSDTRKGSNAKFGARVSGQRSDTILVLHLSPGLRRAVMVSLPRDSVVPVLGCPPEAGAPGQTAHPGQVEQINATFAFGGPGCLWKTIEQTTRIRLSHFVELNFTGFERVINDLGGVNICLPYAIKDPRSKLRLSAGLHHVWGAQALAYWRVRYIGQGSDLQRIQRDQYLMASLAQKVKQAGLLADPARVYRIVSDVATAVTTDSGLSESTLVSLAEAMRSMKLPDVHFIQVPVAAYPENSNWVQWAPQSRSLFSALAHDRKLPKEHGHRHHPAGGTARPASSPPSLKHLSKNYGGITARTNVCHDQGAFTGPLGGN